MYISAKLTPIIRRAFCSSRDDVMPKVDLSKDRLRSAQLDYMKIFQAENEKRVKKLLKLRSKNRNLAFGLGALVIGIYAYSINAVKQEDFLDKLD